jgi:thioredoxin reductase (NADPH)
VVEYFDLPVRDCEAVLSVTGQEGDFRVETQPRSEEKRTYQARRVIVATGYYDNPNRLGIPGEDLAKVSHYYAEAHPYFRKKVAVIGGNNSAAESALELHRSGAEVSLIHRGEAMGKAIKYWVLPDINNRIERQEIAAYFNSRVVKIGESNITIATREGEQTLGNDAVFAMTGYHPDASFLTGIGVQVDPETLAPEHDSQTLETNVKGIFLAGSIVSGRMTNRIFIENGRFHGEQMFQHWDRAQ